MAETIKTSNYEKYQGGIVCTSLVAGYERSKTRVMRYQFSTTSIGASSVSWSVSDIVFGGGDKQYGLKWHINDNSTSYADSVGSRNTYTGDVTISSATASGSANIVLQPNKTYYLWIFPAVEQYSWWVFGETATLNIVGGTSTFTLSKSTVSIGDTITVNITRMSSNFKHKVRFYINDFYSFEKDDVDTSWTTPILTDWYKYLSTSTSCTAYCSVTTYNGSSSSPIGNVVTKSFTVNVGGSAPTVGTIQLTPGNISYISNNILVKGFNSLTIKVTGSKASEGSSIKSCTISGPSLLKTISGSSADATATISSVTDVPSFTNGTTELTYTVTITDTRGKTASSTAKITCYDYYNPTVVSFDAYRANSNGNPDASGSYIYCKYNIDYAQVATIDSSKTNISVSIYYGGSSPKVITSTAKTGSTLIDLSSDASAADKTYTVYANVTDTFAKSGKSSDITIFGSSRILNITSDGTGIAFGKMAESSQMLECVWDAKFHGDVEIKNKSILDLTYPIGSIYMSVNSTNPKDLFGGEWEALKDRFLIGKSSTYTTTGGSATIKLTQNQLPKIEGSIYAGAGESIQNGNTAGYGAFRTTTGVFSTRDDVDMQYGYPKADSIRAWPSGYGKSNVYMSFGNNEAHDNMPPYLPVYMWKRTA